ncbi:hypothetical protein ACWDBD_40420 [Streptomyces sp. NPDC001118]
MNSALLPMYFVVVVLRLRTFDTVFEVPVPRRAFAVVRAPAERTSRRPFRRTRPPGKVRSPSTPRTS